MYIVGQPSEQAGSKFFSLPAELRNTVYELVLWVPDVIRNSSYTSRAGGAAIRKALVLLRVCRQMNFEARDIFWSIHLQPSHRGTDLAEVGRIFRLFEHQSPEPYLRLMSALTIRNVPTAAHLTYAFRLLRPMTGLRSLRVDFEPTEPWTTLFSPASRQNSYIGPQADSLRSAILSIGSLQEVELNLGQRHRNRSPKAIALDEWERFVWGIQEDLRDRRSQ